MGREEQLLISVPLLLIEYRNIDRVFDKGKILVQQYSQARSKYAFRASRVQK